MMGETMDEAMEGENDEEEEAAIVSEILDEIGINTSDMAPDAPVANPAGTTANPLAAEEPVAAGPVAAGAGGGGASAPAVDPAVSELEERLNNLRRNS